MRKDAKCGICCVFVCAAICLCIGLPTYLVGCNDTAYPAGCVAYAVKQGVVERASTSQETCERCSSKSGSSGTRTVCVPYTCYSAHVQWDICSEKLGTWSSFRDAENAASAFSAGKKATVWVSKSDASTCTSNSARVTTSLPIVGITFLTLMGVFSLAGVVAALMEMWS